MEQTSKNQSPLRKSSELPKQTNQDHSSENKPKRSLFREMYNLRPYQAVDLKQTNLHLQEIPSHQGDKTQIQLETDIIEIKALSDKKVLNRLKFMHTSIYPSNDNSPSLIDQAYYEAKALMTDMIEYPTNNTEKYYNMSKEDFNSFNKNKESITQYQQELNALIQYSGVYFHSNQYVRTDAFKEQTVKLYKDISQKVLETYKDCTPIQAIWKHLHGLKETFTQEQPIQIDILSDPPQQLTESPATSTIQKKGWDITPSPENNSIFELTKTSASKGLTCKEIKDFYQEKLETKLKNTVCEGLEKLIKDGKAQQELLKDVKKALDNPQASHWEQLKPKNLDLWCVQNTLTKKVYAGVKFRNNVFKIEDNIIKALNSLNHKNAYSKESQINFASGTDKDDTIKNTNNIAIEIGYFAPKSKGQPKIHVIITDKSKVYITDNLRRLSANKYGDELHIQRKKTGYPDPNWTFYEIDPW